MSWKTNNMSLNTSAANFTPAGACWGPGRGLGSWPASTRFSVGSRSQGPGGTWPMPAWPQAPWLLRLHSRRARGPRCCTELRSPELVLTQARLCPRVPSRSLWLRCSSNSTNRAHPLATDTVPFALESPPGSHLPARCTQGLHPAPCLSSSGVFRSARIFFTALLTRQGAPEPLLVGARTSGDLGFPAGQMLWEAPRRHLPPA